MFIITSHCFSSLLIQSFILKMYFNSIFFCKATLALILFLFTDITASKYEVNNNITVKFQYHNYTEMTILLKNLVKENYNIASLYSIGKSVLNKNLWVLKITNTPKNATNIGNIKLIGNIHGNEVIGKEILIHFIVHLLKNYNKDRKIKHIIDNNVIHVLPSMNPDGLEMSIEGKCSGPGRQNANSVDLNRSFPDYFSTNKIPLQPESQAIVDWMNNIKFILSGSFHGGALVANYPFESYTNLLAPDNDVFKHLALTYSKSHSTMHLGRPCKNNEMKFKDGITNGAAWYSFTGGMQDYNYVMHGCMELTLEISCCKYPYSRRLKTYWRENQKALIEFCLQAGLGVKGIIQDIKTRKPIKTAFLKVQQRNILFYPSNMGTFYRILLPGKYELEISALNYKQRTISFEVLSPKENQYPTMTELVILLEAM